MEKNKKTKRYLMLGTLGTVGLISSALLNSHHVLAQEQEKGSVAPVHLTLPVAALASKSLDTDSTEASNESTGSTETPEVPTTPDAPSDPTPPPAAPTRPSDPTPPPAAPTRPSDPTPPPAAPTRPSDPTPPPKAPTSPTQPTTPPKKPTSPTKPVTPPKKPTSPTKPVTPPKKPTTPTKPVTPPKKPTPPAQPTPPSKAPTAPSHSSEVSSSDSVGTPTEGSAVKKVVNESKAVAPLTQIDTQNQEAFIQSIAPRIQLLAKENHLYASLIIAQAILESGYGKGYLTQKAFNIFNLTGNYQSHSMTIQTLEYDKNNHPYYVSQDFRVYGNYDESLLDYIRLMVEGTTWNHNLYAGSWMTNASSYEKAAESLQGVYATDPNYAKILIELIQEYHLDQYDQKDDAVSATSGVKLDASNNVSDYPLYNGVEYPGSESYAFGNCTQYVYNRVYQLGERVGQYLGNGGEWGRNAQAQGYFTTSDPTQGFAVSFPPGVAGSSSVYGHVAFVEKVYSDGSILVSEMNVIGNNIVSERHINAATAALATYIQPQKR